jgi:hypothetical protein
LRLRFAPQETAALRSPSPYFLFRLRRGYALASQLDTGYGFYFCA